jgi:hypothetical protein
MRCYQIDQDGESIAIVTNLSLARAIARCQPPGYYRVFEIQVDPPIVIRQPPGRRQGIRHSGGRRGCKPGARSGRKISPHIQGAQRPLARSPLSNLRLLASTWRASPPRT